MTNAHNAGYGLSPQTTHNPNASGANPNPSVRGPTREQEFDAALAGLRNWALDEIGGWIDTAGKITGGPLGVLGFGSCVVCDLYRDGLDNFKADVPTDSRLLEHYEFMANGLGVLSIGVGVVIGRGSDSARRATVEELVEQMNKRSGTVAEFATGDTERYLRAIGAEGSHTLLEGGRSHILLRADIATRRTALHEWLHRALQRSSGGPRPGEDAFIEAFLDRHKGLFGLE